MPTYLEVEGVTKIYGEKKLFEKISFQVNQGQKIALVAKNGTGKSTLLNIIAGLDKADEGTIKKNRHISFGYLLQEPVLNPGYTIFDEVYNTENEIQKQPCWSTTKKNCKTP